tara:strand:+ start:376 stop:810 length:435 start_codon:yes stop_codon:yes gene_type:complete
MNFNFFASQEIDHFDSEGNYHNAQAYVDEVSTGNQKVLFLWIDVISSAQVKPFGFDFSGTTGVAVSRKDKDGMSIITYKILPETVGHLTVWLSEEKSITIQFDLKEKYLIDNEGNKFDLENKTEMLPIAPIMVNNEILTFKIKH